MPGQARHKTELKPRPLVDLILSLSKDGPAGLNILRQAQDEAAKEAQGGEEEGL